ncbi:MAG: hypothetical protein ACREIA_25700, partial [Opitutaceae bacterium]
AGQPVREVRLTSAPEQRTPGMTFILGPDAGEGSAAEVVIPMSECWGMDVREAEFVAQQRRRLGFDLVLWRIVLSAAAAMVLLFAGELLLLAGHGYTGWLSRKIEKQAPVVAALEDKHTVANRLADFGASGSSPFVMLATVVAPMPPSLYFTRATAEGSNNLTIDAFTPNVADMNAFEAALRALPEVENVEVQNPRPREDGTTFSVIVTFKAGSFELTADPAANVATAGGGS